MEIQSTSHTKTKCEDNRLIIFISLLINTNNELPLLCNILTSFQQFILIFNDC